MWYHKHEEGVMIQVKVLTHAKDNQIVGIFDDFLKIKITASPEKGKANKALIGFLAQLFHVSQRGVKIVKGELNQIKLIFLPVTIELLLANISGNNNSK
jgi:uncharacterized protein